MTNEPIDVPDDAIGDDERTAHDALEAATEAQRESLPPTPVAEVLEAARRHRDRAARRRRAVRRAPLAAAAVLVLLVAGVVLISRQGDPHPRVAATGADADSGLTRSESSGGAGKYRPLSVDPAEGLVDGQTVHIEARGFDPGTSLRVVQCIESSPGVPVPDASVATTSDTAVAAEPDAGVSTGSDTSPVAPSWLLCAGYEAAPQLTVPVPEGSPVTMVVTDLRVSTSPQGSLSAWDPVSAQRTDLPDSGAPRTCLGSVVTPETSTAPGGTCVVAAIGIRGGEAVFESAPIAFGPAPPGQNEPGSSGITEPGFMPPGAEPGVPSDLDSRCPASPPPIPAAAGNGGNAASLLGYTPTTLIVCAYEVTGLRYSKVVNDAATLEAVAPALNALKPLGPDLACTSEMGPAYVLVASTGGAATTITVEMYGCGSVSDGTNVRVGAKSSSFIRQLVAKQ